MSSFREVAWQSMYISFQSSLCFSNRVSFIPIGQFYYIGPYFIADYTNFYLWNGVRLMVQEYTRSMAYDGFHLGVDEQLVAVNVTYFVVYGDNFMQ